MSINLIWGDSFKELKKFPDKYFDLIITDPPYGVGFSAYDDGSLIFKLEDEMYRVLKNDAWLIFFWSIKTLPNAFSFKKFKYKWMIICNYPTTKSKTPVGDRTYTPILIFKKGEPKVIHRRYDSIIAEELPIIKSEVKSGDFKTTFSLAQLLSMFSKEGDKILDPFMGFGSLGLVCSFFNRDYVGIEIDEKRFKVAERIINEKGITKSIPEMLEELETNRKIQIKLSEGYI